MKNLKTLCSAFFISFATISFAQELIVQNNNVEQLLYRGFRNSISVSMSDIPFEDLIFKCIHCEIQSDTSKNGIIMLPKKERTAELFVSAKSHPDKKIKQSFRVQNLPNPEVFIGVKRNEDLVGLGELKNELKIGYDQSILLKNNFTIDGWEVCKNGKCISGTSNSLSKEAISLLENEKSDSFTLSIKTASLNDGIMRILNARFLMSKD
jgi:hypothetical protein